jgi:hypothetical protein
MLRGQKHHSSLLFEEADQFRSVGVRRFHPSYDCRISVWPSPLLGIALQSCPGNEF